VSAQNSSQNSKRNSQSDLLTQNSEKSSETRQGRPSLRAARRAARKAPRFAFGANTEENTEFASTAGSGRGSGREKSLANLKPWPKGVSGNPGGRPRKQPITEAYLEVAGRTVPGDSQGRTYAQAAAERQFRAALKGSTSAIREIADRLEGRPQQRIEVTNVEDFLAGRSTDEKEFFAVHGYWPDDNAEKEKLQ
jgi:hypothetical protein